VKAGTSVSLCLPPADEPAFRTLYARGDAEPSPLSPGLRELIVAYTSYVNECEFCTEAHVAVAAEPLESEDLVWTALRNLDASSLKEDEKIIAPVSRQSDQRPPIRYRSRRKSPADSRLERRGARRSANAWWRSWGTSSSNSVRVCTIPYPRPANGSSRLCRTLPLLCGTGEPRQSQHAPGSAHPAVVGNTPPPQPETPDLLDPYSRSGRPMAPLHRAHSILIPRVALPPVIRDKNRMR
jgi:AhpD family alkylhydroperoxidase